MSLADLGGWIGTALVLAAFAWVTFSKKPDVWFQLANLVGAALLGLDAISHQAFPIIALNVAWFDIAVVGLWNLWRHRLTKAERAMIAGWPDEAARFGGIDIVVDPLCPPGKAFLIDKRWMVGGDDLVEYTKRLGTFTAVPQEFQSTSGARILDPEGAIDGTKLDPRTWKPVRGRDNHPVYGTDHPPSSWGES